MNKLFHFFSVALLTQAALMLSQLILLPMQIRLWGQGATAQWYAALALANITTVVDFGLRTAGHAELLEHVKGETKTAAAGEHFCQVWSWIRLLMVAMTALLIAAQAGYTIWFGQAAFPLWKIAIILAYSLETLLVIRIIYLDTLGLYRGAEVSYFIFAALRLLLSVPALLLFHFQVSGLAYLFLITSALAVCIQGFLLCRGIDALKLFSALPDKLSVKVLLLARLTVAEPFSNWVRLNLPVVVISAIAPAAAVTTFVGLRAAFGAARTTIQQISRAASVEYLRFRSGGRDQQAGPLLLGFILVASLVATSASVAIILDNMRILGLWLTKIDRSLFQKVEIAFVFSAPFYAYQIPLNLMFRMSELAWIARRHYIYAAVSGVFALVALPFANLTLYVAILAFTEIGLQASFMLSNKHRLRSLPSETNRGFLFCAAGSALAVLLWPAVRLNLLPFLTMNTPMALAETAALAACGLLILLWGGYSANPRLMQMAQSFAFKKRALA